MRLEKRKIMVLVMGLGILLIFFLFAVMPMLKRTENDSEAHQGSIHQEIPPAEEVKNPDNKREGYRNSQNINNYFDSLEEQAMQQENASLGRERPKQMSVEDLFQEQEKKPKAPKSGSSAPRPKPMQETSGPQHEIETEHEGKTGEEKPQEPPRPQVKRSGSVSSLDEDISSDLGNGFSTLDGRDVWISDDQNKPYRCMFTRSEKVRSGQRITIRLLEDLVIGGTHVPRNTHLQGVCTISDRMEISLTSLDVGGRILSFHFEAYDTDGGKGIYCSDLSKEAQEITDRGISIASSTLTGRLGRTARDVASVGASIVRNKSGEVTVSIPSGYTFYIIEETKL